MVYFKKNYNFLRFQRGGPTFYRVSNLFLWGMGDEGPVGGDRVGGGPMADSYMPI